MPWSEEPTSAPASAQPCRHLFERVESVDLPRQVVQPNGATAGLARTRGGAQLKQTEVVVVGGVRRLKKSGTAEAIRSHVDHSEAHHVGVEIHAALDVLHDTGPRG